MEAARAAVDKFTSNRGHRTSVDEVVNPAVTQEAVHPHRHENVTQAVDREVHQHHYHTTVQPINHKETLPEKHTHTMRPTEHKEFRHENDEDTKHRVATELGRFTNSSKTHETKHTQEAQPAVTGEHVHHHVHETVIPVIHKETVQPEVVHTTHPVHETHHVQSQHHGLSALPMKSLDEFKKAGGILTGTKGGEASREEYEGQPRPYNEKLATTFEKLGLSHGHDHGQGQSGRQADYRGNPSGTTTTTTTTTETNMSSNRASHRTQDSGVGLDSPTGARGTNNNLGTTAEDRRY